MLNYILYQIIIYFNLFIIFYVMVVSIANTIQMAVSLVSTPKYLKKTKFSDLKMHSESENMVPISILVPAYNEEPTIVNSIKSLLALNYLTYEIIVINDGSNDATLRTMIATFHLKKITYPSRVAIPTKEIRGIYYNPDFPMLRVVDKENGGKADALNAGINLSRYPYFAAIDADSLLDSEALTRVAVSFMEYKYTVAVGGMVRVANGSRIEAGNVTKIGLPEKILARFQIVEYFRAFLVGRVGWGAINSLLIISGAFGAFQKDPVIKVGGYTTGTIGEDMDLILKLHKYMREKKYQYRISFLPDPICWTQVPETMKDLYGQRRRWQIGLMDSFNRNSKMFFNPRYGMLGTLAMPYYLFFELLAPIVEGLGLIVVPLSYFFGLLSIEFLILFFIAATIFGVILSVGALAIEEYTFNKYVRLRDLLRLSFFSVVENFSYRQLTLLFRLIGIFRYNKYKNAWTKMKRKNFGVAS